MIREPVQCCRTIKNQVQRAKHNAIKNQAQCYQEPSAKHQAQRTMPWKAQQSAIVALLQFLKNSQDAEPPPLVK